MEIKESKKFLYVVGAFPPSIGMGGIRALEFSKRLVKKGIFPIFLTRKSHKKELISKKFFSKIPSSVIVYRSNYFRLANRYIREFLNLFFRIDFYLDWIPFAYLKGKKILKKHKDIRFIYTTGLPISSFIIGYLLKLKFKIPLVVEYRDPWSFNPFLMKNQLLLNQKIDLILEKRWLSSADVIITVSPKLTQFLKKNFLFIGNIPIYSIPNGLNLNAEKLDAKKKDKKNEIVFTFTGKLYGGRNITPLFKIISELKKEGYFDDLRFKLKIFGAYKKIMEKQVKQLNISDIVLLGGFITRSDVFNELYKCDLPIHIGENLNYPTLAFKVFDYLSIGKKMLYLGREDSYTAKYLKENNFGITIPINNFKEGKKKFKNLLNDIKNQVFEYSVKREEILKLSWDNRARDLMEVISTHF